jgi:Zn finger protein HypA/HybF involved in hydrogenase expression
MNNITYRLYGQEMEELMKYIVKNEVKCDHCKDIIESTDTHDFKTCSCGMVSIDGGYDYLKRMVKNNATYEDLSVMVDDEYIKNLNIHKRDGYEISSKMFSQSVSHGEHINCPVCKSSDILILKGNGFKIDGLDFIGIICNQCKKVYYFYDVNFRK